MQYETNALKVPQARGIAASEINRPIHPVPPLSILTRNWQAGEEKVMAMRCRNKLVAIGVGAFVALSLACLGAVLDGVGPHGSTLGFIIRTVPMALAIPLLLVAFNFLCDKWERHDGVEDGTQEENVSTARQPRSDQKSCGVGPEGGRVIGRVTRTENYSLPTTSGFFATRGSRFTHPQGLVPRTLRWGRQGQ
jgi:hypothetical protein